MSSRPRFPIASALLIAANIGAAFAVLWAPDLIDQFGFRASEPSVRTAATSLFLHLNLIHLLGNMVFLAAVGPAVEWGAGAVRFLAVYFVGGLAGALFHSLFAAGGVDDTPLIGASASVAACALYYSVRYYHLRVPILPNVGVPVAAIAATWLVLQMLGGFVTLGEANTASAYWAHIGGATVGLLLSLTFRAPQLAKLQLGHSVLEQMNRRSLGASLAATGRHLERHPGDPKALLERADALAQLGDKDKEADVLVQLLGVLPEEDRADLLDRLDMIGHLQVLDARTRATYAEKLKASRPEVSRLLLISLLNEPAEEARRPDYLLALAGLDLEARPDAAQAYLAELFERYPLHPACDLARSRGWSSP